MSASHSLSHLSSCKLPVYQSGHHRRDLYCRHSGSSNSIILRNDHGTSRDYICDNYICAKIKEVKAEWFEIQKYSPGETVEGIKTSGLDFSKMQAQGNTSSENNQQERNESSDPTLSSFFFVTCVSFNATNLIYDNNVLLILSGFITQRKLPFPLFCLPFHFLFCLYRHQCNLSE